jgi:hypothetical protein
MKKYFSIEKINILNIGIKIMESLQGVVVWYLYIAIIALAFGDIAKLEMQQTIEMIRKATNELRVIMNLGILILNAIAVSFTIIKTFINYNVTGKREMSFRFFTKSLLIVILLNLTYPIMVSDIYVNNIIKDYGLISMLIFIVILKIIRILLENKREKKVKFINPDFFEKRTYEEQIDAQITYREQLCMLVKKFSKEYGWVNGEKFIVRIDYSDIDEFIEGYKKFIGELPELDLEIFKGYFNQDGIYFDLHEISSSTSVEVFLSKK